MAMAAPAVDEGSKGGHDAASAVDELWLKNSTAVAVDEGRGQGGRGPPRR